jgi:hypothetical protein
MLQLAICLQLIHAPRGILSYALTRALSLHHHNISHSSGESVNTDNLGLMDNKYLWGGES